MRDVTLKSSLTFAGLAAMLLFVGCGKPAPPAPAVKTTSTAALDPVSTKPRSTSTLDDAAPAVLSDDTVANTQGDVLDDANPAATKTDETATEIGNNRESGAEDSSITDDPTPPTDPAPSEETEKLPPPERIMLLSAAGPLLVDLHITIDGKAHRQCFDDLIDHVLELGDSNGDGSVTWDELTTHPRFRHGQFGNPPTATYQAQQDMTRLYDTIKNGRVDREEVARFLTSNQGSSRALAVDTSNSNREMNRDESPIRKWLDIDNDLVLSPEELTQAAVRLLQRDVNDDEILLPADFTGSSQPDMMPTRRRPKFYGPDAGWHLYPQTPWSEVLYAWEELYTTSGDLTAEDLMVGSDLFSKVDIDADGTLSAYELATLLEVEPHMAIQIELHPEGEPTPRISLASLRLALDQVHGVVQHQPNRITITLPGLVLDVFALDRLGQANFSAQADAILRQGDADKNDYLSEDEFGAVAAQFNMTWEAVDVDENGKIFADEVVTVLQQRQSAQRGQIRVKADDQSDALISSVDINHDGRIDSREITQTGRVLEALDMGGDGNLQLHEIPSSMVIGVVRGAGRGDRAFQIPTVVRKPSESAPRWFQGMDRNRDGGVSRREFLGTRGQFSALDGDEDGFIDATEAAAR